MKILRMKLDMREANMNGSNSRGGETFGYPFKWDLSSVLTFLLYYFDIFLCCDYNFFSVSREGSGFYCKLTLNDAVSYGVMTCHHVLETREDCNRGYATFFYEGSENRVKVKLSAANIFRTHPVSLKQSLGCNLVLYLKLLLNSTMKGPWNI